MPPDGGISDLAMKKQEASNILGLEKQIWAAICHNSVRWNAEQHVGRNLQRAPNIEPMELGSVTCSAKGRFGLLVGDEAKRKKYATGATTVLQQYYDDQSGCVMFGGPAYVPNTEAEAAAFCCLTKPPSVSSNGRIFLRSDCESFIAEYEFLTTPESRVTFVQSRQSIRILDETCSEWRERLRNGREQEVNVVRKGRAAMIRQKLSNMGYGKELDVVLDERHRHLAWSVHELVTCPQPLTEKGCSLEFSCLLLILRISDDLGQDMDGLDVDFVHHAHKVGNNERNWISVSAGQINCSLEGAKLDGPEQLPLWTCFHCMDSSSEQPLQPLDQLNGHLIREHCIQDPEQNRDIISLHAVSSVAYNAYHFSIATCSDITFAKRHPRRSRVMDIVHISFVISVGKISMTMSDHLSAAWTETFGRPASIRESNLKAKTAIDHLYLLVKNERERPDVSYQTSMNGKKLTAKTYYHRPVEKYEYLLETLESVSLPYSTIDVPQSQGSLTTALQGIRS
ncbi:hypothetical protein C8J56DRAFT_892543 [Mycena floridula]|nr:hypothetical protein C8J56DRAFT_892543 [Mycena floridula]